MNKDNSKYIKLFEYFNEKSVPILIKRASNIIRNDIVSNGDNSFEKEYNIDGLDFYIRVAYINGDKQPYYSNINIYDVISGVSPVVILVNVTDTTIDFNYLMSIISHELRHIYDIYTISGDVEIEDFKKSVVITKYKKDRLKMDFINLVYLSLEHELIARHNMLYELFRVVNITDKDKLYDLFKKSYTYKALNDLNNFNYIEFLKSEGIVEFTIEFSRDINDTFDGNVDRYYKKWNDFFKGKSSEFLSYVDDVLDDVISDVNNNKTYERICGYSSYNEDINNNVCVELLNSLIKYKEKNKLLQIYLI